VEESGVKLTPGVALVIEMESVGERATRLTLYAKDKEKGTLVRLSQRDFATQEKAWLKLIRLSDKQLVELGSKAKGVEADQVQGAIGVEPVGVGPRDVAT
jgi:hypothetical protein